MQKGSVLVGMLLFATIAGCIQSPGKAHGTGDEGIRELKEVKGMKALMIIAPSNFRDEELFHTMEELEKAGMEVTIASKTPGEKRGMLGGTAIAELALKDVDVDEYDAIVFVGGSGASVYYNDSEALTIAKQAYQKGKVLGAICIAPGILAYAGVLQGKKATIWDGGTGEFVSILKQGGAEYTGADVEVDGRIITANGPHAAKEFGKRIANLLGV